MDIHKKKEVTTEVEISKFIDKYWKPFTTVVSVALFAYAIYMGLDFYNEKQELKAQEELFVIQKGVETKAESLAKTTDKNPELLNKEFNSFLSQYDSFISKHKGKKASYIAAVNKAGLASSYNDLALAEKSLAAVVKETTASDLFFGLVRSQLATVFMDQSKFKEASVLLEEIVGNSRQNYFHPHALLRLGTCYLELGEVEKAKAALARIEKEHPNTQAAQEAKNLIKLAAARGA